MGSRLFPFHGGYQGGTRLVSAVPAESPNSAFSTHFPMEVNKPNSYLHLTRRSISSWEKRKQNVLGQHQSQNYGSCWVFLPSYGGNQVQGYKLPSKSSHWTWTEKLILNSNLGLPSSAGFCCLSLHLKMKSKPEKCSRTAFTLQLVGRVTCCTK